MENALLYTFSTIAQTLGGAIALLAAFVLYRFQSLDAALVSAADALRGAMVTTPDTLEFDRLASEGEYEEIFRFAISRVEQNGIYLPRLRKGIAQKARITDAFMGAVSSTGVTMALSVAVLPLAQYLRLLFGMSVLVLAVGVVLFLVCIFSYWLVISAALGLRKFRNVVA